MPSRKPVTVHGPGTGSFFGPFLAEKCACPLPARITEQSGNDPNHHFASAGKMVGIGSEASRELPDFQLSRFACYLIAQNGDPRKPQIANAQKYLAIQTRRQELSDQLAADVERLELRKQAIQTHKEVGQEVREAIKRIGEETHEDQEKQ